MASAPRQLNNRSPNNAEQQALFDHCTLPAKDAGFLQCSTLLLSTYGQHIVTDTTYNGWTNRETWAIGLHLMDTVAALIIDDKDEWSKDDIKDAGQLFKDYVDEMIEESGLNTDYSLLLDLLDLSSVDWQELGEHALDAAFD
jgi:hypothetical protein